MLTQQQIEEMDKITGVTGDSIQQDRISELQALRASRPQPKEKETVMEKIAGFTGGKKIAQGLGQAFANPAIAKQQEQLLNDSINQQSELLKKRKEIKDAGGDTTGVDRALAINTENTNKIAEETGTLLNQKGLTNKQVIGDALQLGTTVLGAGTLPRAVKGTLTAKTFKEGAKVGAKLGAKTGAIYGASSGVSEALQEDKGALDIATEGITGGLIGAGTGAVLGGLTGGVIGKVKGAKSAKIAKNDEFAQRLVMPFESPEVIEQASLQRRVTDQKGLLGKSQITPSKIDERRKELVKNLVNPKQSIQGNLENIGNGVTDINNRVLAYTKLNKVPFNTNQLTKKLNDGKKDLDLIFASDKQAEKTYNAVVKKFLEHVKNKDTKGLLDARQSFDQIPAIKKLLNTQGLGENTKREVVSAVRDSANKYVAELLPKGNKIREQLLKESDMIRVTEILAEKVKMSGVVNRNYIQSLSLKYPWLKWVIGSAVAGGVGVGGVLTAKGGGTE